MNISEKAALELIHAAEAFALGHIYRQYEQAPNPERLSYHVTLHTKEVRHRAIAIAKTIGLGWYDIALTGVAAAFHDFVQEGTLVPVNDTIQRALFTERNEVASADAARKFLADFDIGRDGDTLGLVTQAILATTPAWSASLNTVFQPNLSRLSRPVVRALALADLGSAGLDTDAFLRDGISLFAERNVDITMAIWGADSPDMIDIETQQKHLQRFVQWMDKQPDFAFGRKFLLPMELDGLYSKANAAVSKLFSHFNESIERSREAAAQAREMTYVQMAQKLVPGAFANVSAA